MDSQSTRRQRAGVRPSRASIEKQDIQLPSAHPPDLLRCLGQLLGRSEVRHDDVDVGAFCGELFEGPGGA